MTLLHMGIAGPGSKKPANLPQIRSLSCNILSFLSGHPGHSEVNISVQIVTRHAKFLTCLFLSGSVFDAC